MILKYEKVECDRCGAFRERSERTDPAAFEKWSHVDVVPLGTRFGDGIILCSTCSNEYLEWVEKGKRR